MQYSKRIANQKDFSNKINQQYIEKMLNNRFRTLEYDKNISKLMITINY